MALFREPDEIVREGFNHSRSYNSRPELPPGYNWDEQLKKYCPKSYFYQARVYARYQDDRREKEKKKTKFNFFKTKEKRDRTPDDEPKSHFLFNRFNGVFCHRGFYDRAMKIPENSTLAIENGINQGLLLHELDARFGPTSGQIFFAHDEVARRVTSKDRRWSSLNFSEIIETTLVTRRFDLEKNDFASSYQNTEGKVPELRSTIQEFGKPKSPTECTFQLDLRGNDFCRAIAWLSHYANCNPKILLKGSNYTFPNGGALKAAVNVVTTSEYNQKFEWAHLAAPQLPIIIIFFSQPILALALEARGIDPSTASLVDRSNLDYEHLYRITLAHVSSFFEISETGRCFFIPEIVHSGLGLGYNMRTGQSVDPLDGSPITSPEVVLESRMDRAMIDVSLNLKKADSNMIFSSCTRLCEVRTSKGELIVDTKTGRLKPKPTGEKGISTRLRSIHGGLFPQSDMVVADDPFAEIAARTWIDEYVKLDRAKLLELRYSDWLAQAGQEVVAAVNKLNGPFLPNTFDGVPGR